MSDAYRYETASKKWTHLGGPSTVASLSPFLFNGASDPHPSVPAPGQNADTIREALSTLCVSPLRVFSASPSSPARSLASRRSTSVLPYRLSDTTATPCVDRQPCANVEEQSAPHTTLRTEMLDMASRRLSQKSVVFDATDRVTPPPRSVRPRGMKWGRVWFEGAAGKGRKRNIGARFVLLNGARAASCSGNGKRPRRPVSLHFRRLRPTHGHRAG